MKHTLPSFIISALLIIILFILSTASAMADRMDSASYIIQFGNFNITAGEKSSASFNVTDTMGQTGAGPYGSLGSGNYFVGGGFQYIYMYKEAIFNFYISDTTLDLGILTPGIHNTVNNQLTVKADGNGGYSVYAFEIRPMTRGGGIETIPDTTCDHDSCDESTAAVWLNESTPGFGFNISGDDVASDFSNANYFRQFANQASLEIPQRIMGANSIDGEKNATVTYKAGISGAQAVGEYQTEVVFLAVPGY